MNKPLRKQEQLPPPALANVSAEMAVLGKLLVDGRLWFDIADRLTAEHFSLLRHRAIFKALKVLADRGSPLMRQLVPSVIGDYPNEEIRIEEYLAVLVSEAPETGIDEFIESVIDTARRRQAISEAEALVDQMRKAEFGRSGEILEEAQKRLSLVGTDAADDAGDLVTFAATVLNRAQEIKSSERPAGLMTGLSPFDELVGSMMPGQLIVIGAPAGVGKTSLACQIAIMVAQKGTPVEIFSLEMGGDELAVRILASFSEVSGDKIAEGNLNEMELERVAEAQRRLAGIPFHIDDRPRPTTSTILSRAARAQAKKNVGLFITDHVRMVKADNYRAEERERLEQIYQDHKAAAKRLGVPWILLAHLTRQDISNVKTAKDIRRPMMSNLYGSSAAENTADAVLFVHRPSIILADVKPTEGAKHKDEYDTDVFYWEGKAEFVLSKHRSRKGRGIRTCEFNETTTWFS